MPVGEAGAGRVGETNISGMDHLCQRLVEIRIPAQGISKGDFFWPVRRIPLGKFGRITHISYQNEDYSGYLSDRH